MNARDKKSLDSVRLAQLAEAVRQEKMPSVCWHHPEPVFYDGKRCPCCKLAQENLVALRRRKKVS